MANTNTNTNMTTSSGLTPGMQTYYNRALLETFEQSGPLAAWRRAPHAAQ
ncbi:MAG: hypothetical protein ACLUMK_11390 [Christensenellales bacterium]